ncbi:MAG: hypothetical protein UT32_C0001G0035 [Parcubacteria group bacterium GW2011_GWC2_39_14]|nr:MAG: hypothetical protein UT32_C0001G0035 [Parcubacteria group bacterium GW2011_GWC2_39_14]KKR55459.1 MAG: hypothetical protein UT91_C0001G0034 [Parcubacteria group bacterium GW2011_GWA2_40_23]
MLKRFAFVMILAFLLLPQITLADGAAFIPGPYDDRWDYNQESTQSAIIDFKNGTQKMLLNVGFESAEVDTVWLFPVPAQPEKIIIDVVEDVPNLRGEELGDSAKSQLDISRRGLLALQVYAIPFALSHRYSGSGGTGVSLGGAGFGASDGKSADVLVYETIEKEGITSQIITAKTSVGLFKYLREKNLNIKGGSIPALDEYVGKDFSFVVSWISTQNKPDKSRQEVEDKLLRFSNNYFQESNGIKKDFLKGIQTQFPDNYLAYTSAVYQGSHVGGDYLIINTEFKNKLVDLLLQSPELLIEDTYYDYRGAESKVRGVFVSFPTEKAFYPLKLTSVYGSEIIPTDIRLVGYVEPQTYKDIAPYVETSYYFESDYYDTYGTPKNLFGWENNQSIRYTKVTLKAPSKLFTQDLWFTPNNSIKLSVLELLGRSFFFTFIPLFLICSFLAGIFAAWIAFWGRLESRRKLWRYGLLSWFNFFSIFAVMLVVFFSRTRSLDEAHKATLVGLKSQGLSTWAIHSKDYGRKLLFVILFSLTYVALVLFFCWILRVIL